MRRRRQVDFSSFMTAIAQAGAITQRYAIPELSVEHWDYIASMPSKDAISAVLSVVERFPEHRDVIIKAAGFWNVAVFAKFYFPEEMSEAFGGQHDDFFQCIPRGERDMRINILAPRGAGKSTCMGRIYPIHCIYYADTYKALGMPADNFILIVSYAFMQAKDHIIAIRDALEGEPRFQHLVGHREWGNNMLRTANGIFVVPLSVEKSLRGVLKGRHRPTLVILDDVDATDTVRNPEMREKAREWHDKAMAQAGVPKFTNYVSVETLKHPEALAALRTTRPQWRTIHLKAIPTPAKLYHPEHEDLWEQWAKLFSDMSVDSKVREARADAYFAEHEAQMCAGVSELWPERLSYLEIRKKIIESGYQFTMQEYQNDISSSDEFIFDMERASRFREVPQGFLRDDNVLVKWDSMSGATVFLDWSGTRSDTKNNCFACVVVVVWVPQRGRIESKMSHLASCHGYVYSSWIERGTGVTQHVALLDKFDEVRGLLLSKVTEHVPQFHCVQEGLVDTTGWASSGVRHVFESVLQNRSFKDVDLLFLSRSGAEEKHSRIRSLQAPFDNKWLHFNEVLPAEFERQLRLFPTADYDDGPDALEGACNIKFQVSRKVVTEIRRGSAEEAALRRRAQQRQRI